MNVQVNPVPQQASGVQSPPSPRTLAEVGIGNVMLRDILLKTMFRTNLSLVSEIAKKICLPVPLTQDLVDMARGQRMIEATGTLHATSSNEMGYQLTDGGKARALDALSQSEYYGAVPVPLDHYREQVKRQSIRNIKLDRDQLMSGMGHLILPPDLISNLGPAVTSGRSILMYGRPATASPVSRTGSAPPSATRSMCRAPSNTRAR